MKLPLGIVVDRQGQIYFSDIPTNTIWRITREGKLEAFLSNIYSTNSISFPNQSDKATLLKAAPDGSVTALAGGMRGYRDGWGNGTQFSGIDGMAWAADGSLYVADGVYVRRVTMVGDVKTLGKGALTSQSYGEDLMGLTLSPGGSVYVADYSRRLLQLTPDGGSV